MKRKNKPSPVDPFTAATKNSRIPLVHQRADLHLRVGDKFDSDHAFEQLERFGYERVAMIEEARQFCQRGEVVDVFLANGDELCIVLDYDVIQSITVVQDNSEAKVAEYTILAKEKTKIPSKGNIVYQYGGLKVGDTRVVIRGGGTQQKEAKELLKEYGFQYHYGNGFNKIMGYVGFVNLYKLTQLLRSFTTIGYTVKASSKLSPGKVLQL